MVGDDAKPLGRLLIVEDDAPFRTRLAEAMGKRGFCVDAQEGIVSGIKAARATPPDYAVLDMRLEDGTGTEIVDDLRKLNPDMRIIMLTGYGNIASAVTAIKAGAVDFLSKPADADDIEAALLEKERSLPPPAERPMSAKRVRWEHIQRVYEQCDRNVSETARRLNMHRRTLQRILAKHEPKD
jgi:two-component system response regulator RegA